MARKQAVLLIHGIGEQKPMGTLRGFVDAVWTRHEAIHHPHAHQHAGRGIWSKPDNVSKSFELRKLTTPKNIADIETHFYEFYWAHLMEDTTYGHVLAWTLSLLRRGPSPVPSQLKPIYWLVLFMLIAAFGLLVYAAYAEAADISTVPPWLYAVGSVLLLPLVGYIVLKVTGDAARYLHVAPANIQSRHEIRQAGVDLLKELHAPERKYDRIIIVGHSLGSMIGYDILTHAWIDFNQHPIVNEKMEALEALEELARSEKPPPMEQVQDAQRRYFEELKDNGCEWRVTDFITLGSPLAHAAVLLAKNADDLRQKQVDREFPRCLPELEKVKRDGVEVRRFGYELDRDKKGSYRVPHHAAVFGPTRWTNLYFPCRAIVWGDLVSGPLNEVMGDHMRDVRVSTRKRFGLFTHTFYWSDSTRDNGAHIEALREALDLKDRKVPHRCR